MAKRSKAPVKLSPMSASLFDDEDVATSAPTAEETFHAARQGAIAGIQQCLPTLEDTVVTAAGQFGDRNVYSAGWMDKLKGVGTHLATNVGNRALQSALSQGGVTGLLNDPYAMMHAMKSAAREGIQAALPDIANTVMSAAKFPHPGNRPAMYAKDEYGNPDPISYAAAVYRQNYGANPPREAYSAGGFRKRRPMASARGQFRSPQYSADGFWDTVGNIASKAAPFAPLLLL